MTGAAGVVAAVLLWIGYLHRTRRITWLGALADWIGGLMNRPGWVALPATLFLVTILTALIGFIWDVSLHIGDGRDEGPLANPAHYFILVGLFFLFTAGMAAIVLPLDDKPGPAAVRITRTWYAPVGGILLAATGLYALIGFPLDDIWHRMFGQDVTLWGPTHLMLIGGAGLSLVAVLLLEYEGKRSKPRSDDPDSRGVRAQRVFAFGGLLIGLSVFQVEYDFGVQQFPLVLQPLLITAAATVTLVAARVVLGRGSTLLVVAFAFAVRLLVAWLVAGPIIDAPRNVFPLYLGAAVVVELLALLPLHRNRLWWGALAGLGIATVGMWIESRWVDAVFLNPWPGSMWPKLLLLTVPTGILGGVVGAMLGTVLRGERLPRPPVRRAIMVAAVLVLGASTAYGLVMRVPGNASATITLRDTAPAAGGERMVVADVRFEPADLVSDDPEWVQILSWQGGAEADDLGSGLVVDRLTRVEEGHYRSTRPVPADGTWKTVLRVHDGQTFTAVPIFMAADPGIGAEEVPASDNVRREFIPEITVLQRERSFDHPAWLFAAASLVVLLCSLAMVWGLSWGAARINERYDGGPATTGRHARTAGSPVTAGTAGAASTGTSTGSAGATAAPADTSTAPADTSATPAGTDDSVVSGGSAGTGAGGPGAEVPSAERGGSEDDGTGAR
ncbi:MAG TPA: hypothetical protein VK083_09370 [Nocardia sp.]|uniref:hypothetical protein n=1 Tax=Nocardia sp. TaxID=1821 RepID=UPI002B4B888B|nr:hypothetical protein [Nocardia sp.]HLS76984.1 hypothetical protein [Nocardia sp.]